MILLPLVGFVVGAVVARTWAFAITAALDIIGLTLVALTTDEISGWGDPYVWLLTAIALAATWLGILDG